MEDTKMLRCPVCGAFANSTDQNTAAMCPICGAEYPFVKFFADEEDALLWREKTEKHKKEIVEQTCKKQFGRTLLSLGNRAAAVVTSGNQFLFCANDNIEDALMDVVQISFGGRHCLLLFRDGHVESRLTSGESIDQGQCRVEDWSDVIFVEAGANCSYGIRRDGTVMVSGIPPVPSESIITMKKMKAVAEGEGFVVFLSASGQLHMIIPAGAGPDLKNMQKAVDNCRNAVTVKASKDCVLALDGNRNVHCFCVDDDDPRLGAGTWTDVIMVAADSHYAFGLTNKGKIRLAGRETFMDAGRKDAAFWENNIALACAPSGIGTIALDGTLRLAGNIIGAETLRKACEPYAQRIAAAIIRQQ